MKITVKYILPADFAGEEVQTVDLAEGASVAQLIADIRASDSKPVVTFLNRSIYMVNKRRAELGTLLKDGDEVMIMFVLGGG